jgi:hypothetical protein
MSSAWGLLEEPTVLSQIARSGFTAFQPLNRFLCGLLDFCGHIGSSQCLKGPEGALIAKMA